MTTSSVPAVVASAPVAIGRRLDHETKVEELYRHLGPAVLGYFRAQGVADPEDLLNEVFVQVIRDIGRFRGDDRKLRRWVFSIAHNRMIDHHRARRRRPQPGGPDPDVALVGLADRDAVDERLVDPQLVLALARLSPAQREVVVLRFVADLSIADVSRITRRRPGAIKSLQGRALACLAELLQEVAD